MKTILTKDCVKDRLFFSTEEKQRLVGAFAWLIQEDKKQNPELYKQIKIERNCL